MCNSYNNGHCDYYGVEVRELNYKCERGECMTVKCPKCGKVTDYSYLNKCKCGCEFTVSASEEGIEVEERMTKERLIHLKENCSLVRPNMKELKELYEYILNKELPGSEWPWTATQQIILQYVDEYISKLEG